MSQKACRVFIADDDPTLRMLLRTMLDLEGGFEIVGEAEDGIGTIALAEECEITPHDQCPDIVILDLGMPRVSGFEVIERLKNSCPGIRVIVWSGEDEDAARKKVDFGQITFIQKGNPMALINHLKSLYSMS